MLKKVFNSVFIFCLLSILFVSCNAPQNNKDIKNNKKKQTLQQKPLSSQAQEWPDVSALKDHVAFLSSPELEGRKSTEEGGKIAANYIAKKFNEYGLIPGGDKSSYLQKFYIPFSNPKTALLWSMQEVNGKEDIVHYEYGKQFLPFNFSAPSAGGSIGGFYKNIAFCGYGITDESCGYDDYENSDVDGKVVILLPGAPEFLSVAGENFKEYSKEEYKAQNAEKHGAAAVLIVNCLECKVPCSPESYKTVWPGYMPEREIIRMSKVKQPSYLTATTRVLSLQSRAVPAKFVLNIPALLVNRAVAESATGLSMNNLRDTINETKKPQSVDIEKTLMDLELVFEIKKTEDQNVVGFIEGSDNILKYQTVIVGAHYDHLGKNEAGEYYPGANDNASGVATLLEIAKFFGAPQNKPKRSILFVGFGGEEWGLWGSHAYASTVDGRINPVAMLNVDMIGSGNDLNCYVIGVLRSPELYDVIKTANTGNEFVPAVGLTLKDNIEFAFKYGSDHWSFHEIGIPSLDFTSSRFKNYHTPQDTMDGVNFDKVSKITALVGNAINIIANNNMFFPAPKNIEVPYPSHKGMPKGKSKHKK